MSYREQTQEYIRLRQEGMGAREAFAQAFPNGLQEAQARDLADSTNDQALGQILGLTGGAIGAAGIYDLAVGDPLWGGIFESSAASAGAGSSSIGAGGSAISSGVGSSSPSQIILESPGFGGGDVAFGSGGSASGGGGAAIPGGTIPIGVPLGALAIALGPHWAPGLDAALREPAGDAARGLAGAFGYTERRPVTDGSVLSSPMIQQALPNATLEQIQEARRLGLIQGDTTRGDVNQDFTEQVNTGLEALSRDPGALSVGKQMAMLGPSFNTVSFNLPSTGAQQSQVNRLNNAAGALQNAGIDVATRTDPYGNTFQDVDSAVAGLSLQERADILPDYYGGERYQSFLNPQPQASGAPQALAINRPLVTPQATPPMAIGPIERAVPEGLTQEQQQALDPFLQDFYRDNPSAYQDRNAQNLSLQAALLGL